LTAQWHLRFLVESLIDHSIRAGRPRRALSGDSPAARNRSSGPDRPPPCRSAPGDGLSPHGPSPLRERAWSVPGIQVPGSRRYCDTAKLRRAAGGRSTRSWGARASREPHWCGDHPAEAPADHGVPRWAAAHRRL